MERNGRERILSLVEVGRLYETRTGIALTESFITLITTNGEIEVHSQVLGSLSVKVQELVQSLLNAHENQNLGKVKFPFQWPKIVVEKLMYFAYNGSLPNQMSQEDVLYAFCGGLIFEIPELINESMLILLERTNAGNMVQIYDSINQVHRINKLTEISKRSFMYEVLKMKRKSLNCLKEYVTNLEQYFQFLEMQKPQIPDHLMVNPGLDQLKGSATEDMYEISTKPSSDDGKRGVGILIINSDFGDEKRNITAADKDEQYILSLWNHMNMKILILKNGNKSQIRSLVDSVRKMDHSKYSILMIVASTHGSSDKLAASDGSYCVYRTLMNPFLGRNCPSLVNKPKFFVIDACRGSREDQGAYSKSNNDDNNDTDQHEMLPEASDYILFWSTPPGYVSWYNDLIGSLFLRTLSRQIINREVTEDFLSIATKIIHFVSENSIFYYKDEEDFEKEQEVIQRKRTPWFASTLRKKLFL